MTPIEELKLRHQLDNLLDQNRRLSDELRQITEARARHITGYWQVSDIRTVKEDLSKVVEVKLTPIMARLKLPFKDDLLFENAEDANRQISEHLAELLAKQIEAQLK